MGVNSGMGTNSNPLPRKRFPTTIISVAVKIKDIANHLGIAPSTVSKVLNNYPHVSAEMRQTVIAAAQSLGYVPSAAARNLRRQKSNKIGFLYGYAGGSMSTEAAKVMTGAVNAAEQIGYNVTIYSLNADELEWQMMQLCRSGEVDGILLFGTPSENKPLLPLLQAEKTPFVLIGHQAEDKTISFIRTDEMASTYTMTHHLLGQGHRQIAYATHADGNATNRERFSGYKIALEEAGIAIDLKLVVPTSVSEDSGYLAMHSLLDLENRPTAIFANHDLVAVGCLRAAIERGLSVPADVAIAGFGNLRISLTTQPPLTTIRLPLAEMGSKGMQLLAAKLTNPDKIEQVSLSAEIILRGSTSKT